MPPRAPAFSIVVPFFNEECCVVPLVDEIRKVMSSLRADFEIIAVDDGSTDATPSILDLCASLDSRIRVLHWESNRGQGASLFEGLIAAQAPVLITMDGDGQNDPADIPRLLAALDGHDMVVGIRRDRHDSVARRSMSRVANLARSSILGDAMKDSGCALKVFRQPVVRSLIPIRTLYSFVPALAIAGGFDVIQIDVAHRARKGGRSNYGIRQFLWRPLLDLIGVWWFINRRFSPSKQRRSEWERNPSPIQSDGKLL